MYRYTFSFRSFLILKATSDWQMVTCLTWNFRFLGHVDIPEKIKECSRQRNNFKRKRSSSKHQNFGRAILVSGGDTSLLILGSIYSMAMACDANGRFLYTGFRRHPMPSHVASQLIKILQDLDSNSLTKEFFQKKTHLKWVSIFIFRWISDLPTLSVSSKTTTPCSWLLSVHEVGCWPWYVIPWAGSKGSKTWNNFCERNGDGDVKGKRKGLTSFLFRNWLFSLPWLYIMSFFAPTYTVMARFL